MKQPVGDILFTIAAWALAAYAGRALLGVIEGVALWRVVFAAGAAGGIIGIAVGGRSYAPPRSARLSEPPSWIPPRPR